MVSVGKVVGGTKANIVSKYTEIDISMRYFNSKVRELTGPCRHKKTCRGYRRCL